MKRRILSVLLLLALTAAMLPMKAQAAEGTTPIYLGYDAVDYMAEEILKEIPTQGKPAREQIRAVYDWVLENCQHTLWDSPVPEAPFFDESQVEKGSKDAYADAISQGKIAVRLELERYVLPSTALQDGVNYPCDTNEYIAAHAKKMMLDRTGNGEDYAALMTVLLSHLGFDTRLVTDARLFENSEEELELEPTYWNYVLVDGHYYFLDAYGAQEPGQTPDDNFLLPFDQRTGAELYICPLEEAAQNGQIREAYAEAAALAAGPWSRCSDWAYDYMQKAGEAGLIPDRLSGQDLVQGITRAEFSAVAVQLYDALTGSVPPYIGENPFTDTADEDVLLAYGLGIVNGVGSGRFAPDATLTREQAVTMLGRVYELAQTGAVSGGATLEAPDCTFPDHSTIGDYAKPYVNFFVDQGIVNGMSGGIFGPLVTMTREQALKVAVETAEKLG